MATSACRRWLVVRCHPKRTPQSLVGHPNGLAEPPRQGLIEAGVNICRRVGHLMWISIRTVRHDLTGSRPSFRHLSKCLFAEGAITCLEDYTVRYETCRLSRAFKLREITGSDTRGESTRNAKRDQ